MSALMARSRHPVIIATGEKSLDQVDFHLLGPIELDWRRQYRSGDARNDGWFGQGWSHALATELWIEDDVLRYWDEQGREVVLPAVEVGQEHFQTYEQFTLNRRSLDHWTLSYNDGLSHHFRRRSAGQWRLPLEVIQDRNRRRLTLDFDDRDFGADVDPQAASPRPWRLIDSAGRTLQLGWTDQGQLSEVVLKAGGAQVLMASYRYSSAQHSADGQFDLVSHTDPNGDARTYMWDRHMLVGYTLATGQRFSNRYDCLTPAGRVTESLALDDGTGDWFDYNGRTTRVRDRLGRETVYVHNARQDITAVHDAEGNVTRIDFDGQGRPDARTDALGRTRATTFDVRGNLTSMMDTAGNATKVEYNALNLPIALTDAMGSQWRRQYDERGNLIASTDPLGHTTRYEVDATGQVTAMVDALGKRKTFRWDEAGNLIAYTDCSGSTTRQAYDALGNLSSSTDALDQRTDFDFDALGRLRQVTYPDGGRHHYAWDGEGNLVRYMDPMGRSTIWTYNGAGAPLTRVDPLAHALRYRYDHAGRLATLTNENGEVTWFRYDWLDRLTDEVGFDGRHRRYTYNAASELTHVVERGGSDFGPGKVTRFERDAVGRMTFKDHVGEAAEHAASSSFSYDAVGRLTMASNACSELKFAYDSLGQLQAEKQVLRGPIGDKVFEFKHDYDAVGNRTQTVLPNGREVNHLFYGSGHLHQVNLDGEVISDFERDALYREVRRSQGQLHSEFAYDRAGRLKGLRVLRGSGSEPSDRTQAKPIGAESPAPRRAPEPDIARGHREGVIERHYQYDPSGELLEWLDKQRGLTRYHFDAGRRITTAQVGLPKNLGAQGVQGLDFDIDTELPTVVNEQFHWDAASNLFPDEMATAGKAFVTGDRLLIWQDSRYAYDEHGNLVERLQGKRGSAAQTRTSFDWDAAHQLVCADVARGSDEFAVRQSFGYYYDALGRRVAKSDSFGTTCFAWDGDRMAIEQRGGNETIYLYHTELFVPFAQLHDGQLNYVHADHLGTPLEASNDAGEITWRMTYSAWGNVLVEEATAIEQKLRFQGQYHDVETGLNYNQFRYYEPIIGRFVSQDPIGLFGGTNQYQYAPNPISWIDPYGLTTCCLSAADKDEMGPPPPGMQKPHRHHIVREMAPKGWSPANRSLILDSQAILHKYNIDENTSKENFTWATNGCGAHTIKAAKHVHDRLVKADNLGGKQGVIDELASLKIDLSKGKFF